MGQSTFVLSLAVAIALGAVNAAPYESDAVDLFLNLADLLQLEAKREELGPKGPTADSKFALDALKVHSMARAERKASNMMRMSWDQDLADLAAEHADKCVYKHGTLDLPDGTRVGQNMARAAWTEDAGEFPAGAHVNNWNFEIKYFNNGTARCDEMGDCGHYSQVVWASTTKLGCAHKFCPNLESGSDIIVCNYLPFGNDPGPAYATNGEPCSDCNLAGGTACVDNQCVDCASDPLAAANAQCKPCDPTKCQDELPMGLSSCGAIMEGICSEQMFQSFAVKHCRKHCGFCKC